MKSKQSKTEQKTTRRRTNNSLPGILSQHVLSNLWEAYKAIGELVWPDYQIDNQPPNHHTSSMEDLEEFVKTKTDLDQELLPLDKIRSRDPFLIGYRIFLFLACFERSDIRKGGYRNIYEVTDLFLVILFPVELHQQSVQELVNDPEISQEVKAIRLDIEDRIGKFLEKMKTTRHAINNIVGLGIPEDPDSSWLRILNDCLTCHEERYEHFPYTKERNEKDSRTPSRKRKYKALSTGKLKEAKTKVPAKSKRHTSKKKGTENNDLEVVVVEMDNESNTNTEGQVDATPKAQTEKVTESPIDEEEYEVHPHSDGFGEQEDNSEIGVDEKPSCRPFDEFRQTSQGTEVSKDSTCRLYLRHIPFRNWTSRAKILITRGVPQSNAR